MPDVNEAVFLNRPSRTRIVVGHGDVIPSDGRQEIERAYRWLLH